MAKCYGYHIWSYKTHGCRLVLPYSDKASGLCNNPWCGRKERVQKNQNKQRKRESVRSPQIYREVVVFAWDKAKELNHIVSEEYAINQDKYAYSNSDFHSLNENMFG